MLSKEYLGDSVYVEDQGDGVLLTTENGGDPSNIIFLENEVFHKLNSYMILRATIHQKETEDAK